MSSFLNLRAGARITCTIVLVQILWFLTANSFPISDKIVRLPGQPKVRFQQFSGYITVDEKQDRALFYYLVEAEKDPLSKPLVLWLNGGPGCSSVGYGAFTEHGPFKFNGNHLIRNQYSWNKEANILYLESPAGVGFSYSANKSFYINVNDEIAARDSLIFLQRWFDKFPEYKSKDFYITGESYGGHYVPQLAQLILNNSNVKLNLKGIAIGNPLLEFNSDFNSRGEYFWSHGLISDSTLQLANSLCNFSQYMREGLVLKGANFSTNCYLLAKQVSQEVNNFIDEYDVIGDYCNSTVIQSQKIYRAFGIVDKKETAVKYGDCIEINASNYLNRKDVQKALHARLVGVADWKLCSKILNYDLHDLEIPTIHILPSILKSGIRVLIYSGDQDSVIPLISTRSLVAGVAKELGLNTSIPYRAWFESKQVGGWVQVYGNTLSYAAIRGASHATPITQPARSLVLFNSFLADKPLPADPY
ncbi:Serine carboxypeptidase-like [Trema orientale]|uniref:Carboxypeptidase n=1 Tax=Trema orientale TaxID=63057 RepID=A0A2P5C899_TREOI|nr:Serine carboxypeptidase-like [Trema orientale]